MCCFEVVVDYTNHGKMGVLFSGAGGQPPLVNIHRHNERLVPVQFEIGKNGVLKVYLPRNYTPKYPF
jgi:hypothetical protein